MAEIFALLIDGDNVPTTLIPQILDKINESINPIIRNVYLNNLSVERWQNIVNKYSLHPVWVPNNTSGKNAADIALVIDAMDLFYNDPEITGFCIISSDSDFTRLASYITRKHKIVLGVGEKKTPESFINACTEFIYIPELLQASAPLAEPAPIESSENHISEDTSDDLDTSQSFEKQFVRAYEKAAKKKEGWASLIDVKEQLEIIDPEFSARVYQNTRELAEKIIALSKNYPVGVIEVDEKLDNKPVIHFIRLHADAFIFFSACKYAPFEKNGWISLSAIGKLLKKYIHPKSSFTYRGIKKLHKIIPLINTDYPGLFELKNVRSGRALVYYVRSKKSWQAFTK